MLSRFDHDRDALGALLVGEPRYRVDQVWQGLYEHLADPDDLTNLPIALRAKLTEQLPMALAYPAYLAATDGPALFVFRLGTDLLIPTLALGVVGLTSHYCLTQAFRSGDATVVVPLDFLRIPLIFARACCA